MRSVLVSYLDRRKIIKIPDNKKESDLQYLSSEVLRAFNFVSSVQLNVTFQKYSEEWGEVDLDEIDGIADRDKLKVVITPMLESLPSSAASSSVNDLEILDEVSNEIMNGF